MTQKEADSAQHVTQERRVPCNLHRNVTEPDEAESVPGLDPATWQDHIEKGLVHRVNRARFVELRLAASKDTGTDEDTRFQVLSLDPADAASNRPIAHDLFEATAATSGHESENKHPFQSPGLDKDSPNYWLMDALSVVHNNGQCTVSDPAVGREVIVLIETNGAEFIFIGLPAVPANSIVGVALKNIG
ncbi:MAG: hypothetical protein MI923_16190 [Phycisphaerales bacterium]|nr:hypothetical protein [Phycisphaerales bacterium]